MHVLYDENGNLIPHGGEHAHHDHEHCHDHNHDHNHQDGACEGHCGHCGNHTPEAETIALMSYMVDHNKHHAQELVEMAAKLRELGKNDAADQIDRAVTEFESGNVRLGVALSLLKA